MSDIASQLFEAEHGQFRGGASCQAVDALNWAQWEVEKVAKTMNVISTSLGSVRCGVGANVRDIDLEGCLVLLEGRLRAASKAIELVIDVDCLNDQLGQDGTERNKAG
jgi:hypothetical protein